MCQHEMTDTLKMEKKKSGLQLRDSQSTSEDQHKTSLTEEAQASPCPTLYTPFHWDCKSIFLNLLIEFSNPYSSKAQSFSMSRFSHYLSFKQASSPDLPSFWLLWFTPNKPEKRKADKVLLPHYNSKHHFPDFFTPKQNWCCRLLNQEISSSLMVTWNKSLPVGRGTNVPQDPELSSIPMLLFRKITTSPQTFTGDIYGNFKYSIILFSFKIVLGKI